MSETSEDKPDDDGRMLAELADSDRIAEAHAAWEQERRNRWKPAAALVWSDGSHAWVLDVAGGVFDRDDFEGVAEPPFGTVAVGRGLWVWEGLAGWSSGTYECPNDVDLEVSGEWRRASAEEAQGMGVFAPATAVQP